VPKDDGNRTISVIVPKSPFVSDELRNVTLCLAALDVEKLMAWWPGTPHSPHRDPSKVREIQRSLDWKRVAQIAAYLLQEEIRDTPAELDECFSEIYAPKKLEPGREWPPRVRSVTGFESSGYPVFSNVLVHINGAKVVRKTGDIAGAAFLSFDENSKELKLSVIDGQHRINGAYFALHLLRKRHPLLAQTGWEIPAEIFVDLDPVGAPPRRQAQVFIDVNFYQKKVDRSLVADLYPTTRSDRPALDEKERAEDIGRRLMLEQGPLVGMIQIPGIKYGVKDVVTLATLNGAIEEVLPHLRGAGVESLAGQTTFLANALEAWLLASGRMEELAVAKLDPENVAYQGRVLVSFLTLVPACIRFLKSKRVDLQSEKVVPMLASWLADLMKEAGLFADGKFIPKSKFRTLGYLGSGGIGRFRDTLWAAVDGSASGRMKPENVAAKAEKNRNTVHRDLARR
jgi:DGQHR domain-containing protein